MSESAPAGALAIDMGRSTTSDAELVEASRRGERAAFGELVERYQRVVCAVGYSGTSDRSLGEDVAQDTFVTAFHQLDQLRDVSRVREWLCGIARNLARKARRVRAREDVIDEAQPDANASPFDTASEQERDAVVAAALERMPETYREALVLYYVEQRSVTAVASALGISPDAVHQRLSRGRQLVAAEVAELVEHTLERRRTRRNLAVAVLAALPVVTPSHANASNTSASGGTSMSKIGIAALLMAAVGGTGYAVHRVYASHSATQVAASARSTSAPAQLRPHASTGMASFKHGRVARSASAPPALPAGSAAYDCAAAAAQLATLTTQLDVNQPSVHMTRDQVEALRAAYAAAGDPDGMIVIEDHGGSGNPMATVSAQLDGNMEHQCLAEHWPQTLIDCLATADDIWSTMQCSHDGSAADGPTPEQLAAVSDTSCPAVAKHVASIIMPALPPVDPNDVPSLVIAEMNAQMAELPTQIEATCASANWSETFRRCMAAVTSTDELAACD